MRQKDDVFQRSPSITLGVIHCILSVSRLMRKCRSWRSVADSQSPSCKACVKHDALQLHYIWMRFSNFRPISFSSTLFVCDKRCCSLRNVLTSWHRILAMTSYNFLQLLQIVLATIWLCLLTTWGTTNTTMKKETRDRNVNRKTRSIKIRV